VINVFVVDRASKEVGEGYRENYRTDRPPKRSFCLGVEQKAHEQCVLVKSGELVKRTTTSIVEDSIIAIGAEGLWVRTKGKADSHTQSARNRRSRKNAEEKVAILTGCELIRCLPVSQKSREE